MRVHVRLRVHVCVYLCPTGLLTSKFARCGVIVSSSRFNSIHPVSPSNAPIKCSNNSSKWLSISDKPVPDTLCAVVYWYCSCEGPRDIDEGGWGGDDNADADADADADAGAPPFVASVPTAGPAAPTGGRGRTGEPSLLIRSGEECPRLFGFKKMSLSLVGMVGCCGVGTAAWATPASNVPDVGIVRVRVRGVVRGS